jgi:Asp-tRNA(Asn)/Glu-tRNA(Gln) amidotransferase A subunit family amidase
MELLEPGFAIAADPPRIIGRLVVDGVDPAIDAAVDRALALAEVEVVPVELPGWVPSTEVAGTILLAEAFANDAALLASEHIGDDVRFLLGMGQAYSDDDVARMRPRQRAWQAEVAAAFERVEVIATPTLKMFPPRIDAGPDLALGRVVESAVS